MNLAKFICYDESDVAMNKIVREIIMDKKFLFMDKAEEKVRFYLHELHERRKYTIESYRTRSSSKSGLITKLLLEGHSRGSNNDYQTFAREILAEWA